MRARDLLLLCALAGGLTGGLTVPARAGDIAIESAGYTFNVHVATLKELRFRRVIKQKYDFSCGSAAIATLLTYHYNRPTPEDAVLKAMFAVGDQAKIRKEGFSMLDMKKYLASRGYRAQGYRVSLDKIAQVGIPGIVLIRTRGYLHFVVLKGIRGDQVLVGDSALGSRSIPRRKFQEIWNGIFLVIVNDMREARNAFNLDRDWKGLTKAPLRAALPPESLAALTLLLPGPNSF